jgi:hypothetical protein
MNGLATTRILKLVMPEVPVIMFSPARRKCVPPACRLSKFEHISVFLNRARSALEPKQLRAFQPLSTSSRRR